MGKKTLGRGCMPELSKEDKAAVPEINTGAALSFLIGRRSLAARSALWLQQYKLGIQPVGISPHSPMEDITWVSEII